MAALVEAETYEAEIYQLEITDPVIAGPDGIDNLQPKQLANRTKWLKAKVDYILGLLFTHNTTLKALPSDADEFGYLSSTAAWSTVKMTGTNFKAWLKTYFDTVYAVLNSPAFTGTPTVNGNSIAVVSPTITSGSAVFTNTTNNITLTGIGVGVEVGDVITISGSVSNNKEFTVEVITDANNIIVNQAHAGKTTTKALINETATVTVKLLAKWYNASDGLGQDWVEMTASRVVGTSYPNNTRRSIFINPMITQSGSNSSCFSININGVITGYSSTFGGGNISSCPIEVARGGTYSVAIYGTGASYHKWMERR